MAAFCTHFMNMLFPQQIFRPVILLYFHLPSIANHFERTTTTNLQCGTINHAHTSCHHHFFNASMASRIK